MKSSADTVIRARILFELPRLRRTPQTGEVAAGGLEVLSDGGDLGTGGVEIAEQGFHFRSGFAEADHKAGLHERRRGVTPRESEDVQGLAIFRLGAHAGIEARHGFHIVIEDVGRGIEHAGHGIEVAAEIRREDFDAGGGQGAADLANGFGEMVGAAIRKIVAIDAGDHDVAEVHVTRHASNVGGLGGIEADVMLPGIEFADAAEAAAARAKLAENHESGGAAVKALVDIGAARFLADGMEVEFAEAALQVIEGLEMGFAFARPFGQTGAFGRRSVVPNLH